MSRKIRESAPAKRPTPARGAARKKAARKRGRGVPEPAPDSLGLDPEAIRFWRLRRGHTRQSLAAQTVQLDGQRVQISYAQLRRIERDGAAGPNSARILAALLGVEIEQLHPRDPKQRPCGVPRDPSADFVGREAELAALLEALHGKRGAVVLSGLPGVGKTELALRVCAHFEEQRSLRIFWLDASSPDLTAEWGERVARHLGIDGRDPEERAQLAVRVLEALTQPVLIVLDNAEEWTSAQPWPRPRGRHIRWLVTTRVTQLGAREFAHVELPVLAAADAEQLLLRIAGGALAQAPGFRELLEHLDGYTLAVELAGAFLARFPEVTPREYLDSLRSGSGEFEAEVEGHTGYGAALERALELLWARLPQSLRGGWLLASCFAQADVGPELSQYCELERRTRGHLRDYHVLKSDGQVCWSMHRLVREFAQRKAEPAELARARARFVAGCAARVRAGADGDPAALYRRDGAHLERALELAASAPDADAEALALLRWRLAEMRAALGIPRPRAWLEQAAQYCRGALGGDARERDPLGWAARQHQLGTLLGMLGWDEYEQPALRDAAAACRAALEVFDRERTPREWAAAQRTLGRALEMLEGAAQEGGGDPLELAVLAYRAALQVYTPEQAPREWASAQKDLGYALGRLGHRGGRAELLEESARLYRAALEARGREAAPLEWASLQVVLAASLSTLAEQAQRAECAEQALAACAAALEVYNPEQMPLRWATCQHQLGLAQRARARGEDAALLEAAAQAFRDALGPRTRAAAAHQWAASTHELGVTLRLLGARGGRPELLEEAVRCARGALGEWTRERTPELWGQASAALGECLRQLGEQRGDAAQRAEGEALLRAARGGEACVSDG